ncbi:F-box domain-containing protein [Pseudomonas caspiana]|nr:F-box protein [Pseudomonas caspiana]TPG87756.1 F-box domain-containing protein [Pseudomonas caspiana]
MNPIRGSSAYNVQASSANPAEAAQTAVGAHPSGHASSLTLAMLSHHALDALKAKETQGDEQEKTLARFAKEAIGSGQLQISPNQPANGIAQFGMRRHQDVLVIKAKVNERSEYDVLSVGFRRGSEGPISMTLPGPSAAGAGRVQRPSALMDLPNELKQHIVGYLDGASSARATRVSTKMRAAVLAHKDIDKTLQAGNLMARLKPLLNSPPNTRSNEIDAAILNDLRQCSAFLAPEEVEHIMRSALTEGDFGFTEAPLLGPLISGQSKIKAEDLARQLDQIHTRFDRGGSQDAADKQIRSYMLAQILGGIGHASTDLYAPFLERLRSDDCVVSGRDGIVLNLRESIANMPPLVRDDVCSVALARELAGTPDEPDYENTLQMFIALQHLSPSMQGAVFAKAKEIWERFPPGDDKEFMADEFDVDNESSFEGLPQDVADKWKDLFAS